MSKVIDVRAAVGLIQDGATVVIGGSGAGHALPQRFIDELAAVYQATGRPRDLTTVRVVGIGDFADRGFSQLGLPGLMKLSFTRRRCAHSSRTRPVNSGPLSTTISLGRPRVSARRSRRV